MQYGPVIIMLQALCLIMLEKTTMLFPRLSQKLERFYKSVVEEALLGKDPIMAEDFTGTAISTEKVLRERQREEICGALRNSSIFYYIYLIKNGMQVCQHFFFTSPSLGCLWSPLCHYQLWPGCWSRRQDRVL